LAGEIPAFLKKKKMKFGKGRGNPSGDYKGRNKGGAYGPEGFCVCVKCGHKVMHQRGEKCTKLKCPECGHTMVREELVKNKK